MENSTAARVAARDTSAQHRDPLTVALDDMEVRLLMVGKAAGDLGATVDDSIEPGLAPCEDEHNLATDRVTKLLARISDVWQAFEAVRERANVAGVR